MKFPGEGRLAEHVYLDEDGNPQVVPEVHQQLERRKKKRNNCVQYVQYVLQGLIECLERPGEVKGFDKAAFKRDILEIIEGLLQQAA
ncbi:MAG: hypothetical protein J5I98_09915 [Phaeodactylibacter sp.]|nr:hypothetical protein [Phaeodactylibacter sp.]